MLSSKTDLTENRVFSGSNGRVTNFIPVDSSIRIDELIDSLRMSQEEYEKILAYEKVFGRKRHFTSAIDVFRKSDYEWRMEMNCHCQRCGKIFRIPWKRKYDLCPECDDELEIDVDGKVPWSHMKKTGEPDGFKETLRLR